MIKFVFFLEAVPTREITCAPGLEEKMSEMKVLVRERGKVEGGNGGDDEKGKEG